MEMGAQVDVVEKASSGGEPVGDLRVRASACMGLWFPPPGHRR